MKLETNGGIASLEALVTNTILPNTVLYNNGSPVPGNGLSLPYDNANATIGIGDNGGTLSPVPAVTDYSLNGTTNTYYQSMDSGFPKVSAGVMTWQATYGSSTANFAWNEWGVFNGRLLLGSNLHGVMLNHKVVAMGTKSSGSTWVFAAEITQT